MSIVGRAVKGSGGGAGAHYPGVHVQDVREAAIAALGGGCAGQRRGVARGHRHVCSASHGIWRFFSMLINNEQAKYVRTNYCERQQSQSHFNIVEFLAQENGFERSRTFLEITDAHGRVFRYVSMKDRQSNGEAEQTKMDEDFRKMVERMSDQGTHRT
jgi:hypothetical protein